VVKKNENDFAKRAEDLLTARRDAVAELGDLLATRDEQAAALADTDARIEKSITACLEAGWKPNELTDIGVPKTAMPKRPGRSAAIEPRTPATGEQTSTSADGAHDSDGAQTLADGGHSPELVPAP
jgi:hypothetical protein